MHTNTKSTFTSTKYIQAWNETLPYMLILLSLYENCHPINYIVFFVNVIRKLVETARLIMVKRNETGHIRPCHIRESYRKSKLQGKVIRRSVPRLSAKSESDSEKDKIITSFFFVQDKSLYLNLRFLKAKPINIWIVLFSVLLYKCAGTIRIKKTNRPVRKWKHSSQITTQENRHK